MNEKRDPEKIVREIKRKTRCKFSSEIMIHLYWKLTEGLRGEAPLQKLSHHELLKESQ